MFHYSAKVASAVFAFAFLSTGSVALSQVRAPSGWTQRSTPAGEVFTPSAAPDVSITIRPPEALTGDLARWFGARTGAEAKNAGTILKRTDLVRNSPRSYGVAVEVKDNSGRPFTLAFVCLQRVDGKGQLLVTRVPSGDKHLLDYGRVAAALTLELMRDDGTSSPPQSADDASAAPLATMPPISSSNGPAVVALLHEGKGVTTGSGYRYQEQIDVLFADGSAYEQLKVSPELFDARLSRQTEPAQWRHWRKQGDAFLWDKDGKWAAIDADPVRPLEQGAHLNWNLHHLEFTSFGLAGGSSFRQSLILSPDGHFSRSKSATHSSGAMQASADAGGSASGIQDRNGRRSSSSAYGGSAVATANSNQPGKGAGDMAGTYNVHGYTLELHTDGGAVERLLLCYPFPGHNDRVYIDGTTYNSK